MESWRHARMGSCMYLYLVESADALECDYVIARSPKDAVHLFQEEYGDIACSAEEITSVEEAIRPTWVGPDPDLAPFGGVRLDSIDTPRWRFGERVTGPSTTLRRRYAPSQ
jgi:hypothetical protein